MAGKLLKTLIDRANSSLDDAARAAAKQADEAARKIRVYHGTPHKFPAERLVEMPDGSRQWLVGGVDQLPDIPEGAVVVKDAPLGRFRMDKIGAGEGAQAYGHGLYTAERKGTAKWYRDNLSEPYPIYRGQPIIEADKLGFEDAAIARAFQASAKPEETIQKNIEKTIETLKSDFQKSDGFDQDWDRLVRERASDFSFENTGSLYTSEIPDGDYLLWDKPLSEQPEIFEKLWPLLQDSNISYENAAKTTGKQVMHMDGPLAAYVGPRRTPQEFSHILRSEGIPGIKYLDGTSRSAGEGAYNYVLFDEDLIDIKERGKIDPRLLAPLGAAAAGAGALMASQDSQAGVGDDIVKGVMRGADDAAQAAANQLDMSTAARMQRAAEQGFDTSMPLYHGTGSDFDGFYSGRRGTYLSPNPEIADIYAANSAKRWPGESNAGPNVVKTFIKGKSLRVSDQGPTGGGWLTDNLAEKLGVNLEGVPARHRMQYLSEEAVRQGYSAIEIQDIDDLGGRQTQIRVINPSDIRSVNAAFDPANIGKNDLLGAATIGGMATAGAVGAGLMGAQAYDFGTPDYDAKVQAFNERQRSKKNFWKELKEAGAYLGNAIGAGVVSEAAGDIQWVSGMLPGGQAYREGYDQFDAKTNQTKEAFYNALMKAKLTGDNRFLQEFGQQIEQAGEDFRPAVDAIKASPLYPMWQSLPEPVRKGAAIVADWLP